MARFRHNEAADRLAAALSAGGLEDGWGADARAGADASVRMPSPPSPDGVAEPLWFAEREPVGGEVSTAPDDSAPVDAVPVGGWPDDAAPVGGGPDRLAGSDRVGASPRGRGGRHTRVPEDRPGWVTVPAGVRGGRLRLVRPAVLAAIVLVVVFAAVFGARLLLAQRMGEPVAPGAAGAAGAPLAAGRPASAGSSAATDPAPTDGAAGSTPGGAASAADGIVVVHVVGQVRRPGVVELAAGGRVVDAIAKAGGARGGADLAAVNLARLLVDGEQILVPKPGQSTSSAGAGPGATGGTGASGATPGAPAPVNLNTADLTALDGLPGVGPVLAGRILAWRAEHGRFSSVDELGEVSGIGEKVLANLRPLVTV